MAYSTVEEVLGMLREDTWNAIIGDEYIEDMEDRRAAMQPLAETAIQDADAEIDGYLARRYRVPMEPAPRVLNKFSRDIAIYNLVSRTGIDEGERDKTYLNRYNQAIKFLEQVASGLIRLGMDGEGTETAAATGFSMHSRSRVFSRDSMKGY